MELNPDDVIVITPANIEKLLIDRAAAIADVEANLPAYEAMTDSQLLEAKDAIFRLQPLVGATYTTVEPRVPVYSPAFLEFQEWKRTEFWRFMYEIDVLMRSVRGERTQRLRRLLARLKRVEVRAEILSEASNKSAGARWSRLDAVKQWAFEKRATNPEGKRAALIKRIRAEVRERAKIAGEPLTGGDEAVTRTITGWFRKAGIK